MERSFARGIRYGFDQARWRGLWRMRIQEYLTCAIQNIQILIKYLTTPKKSIAAKALAVNASFMEAISPLIVVISAAFCGQGWHYKLSLQKT